MRQALHAILLMTAMSAIARADGAFPSSFAMFAPVDQPGVLRLATNFGLVVSSDDGQSWHYVCENAIIAFASLYTQGPDDALYVVSTLGLVSSRDGGCSWKAAQGSLSLSAVDDVFADPSNAQHVLAIARVVGDSGTAGDTSLYASSDGGLTFGAPLYAPQAGRVLTGVEISRSDPNTIYLTMYDPGPHPYLAHSSDGGAHFTVIDLGGSDFPRLIAVDPKNPQRLFLRLGTPNGDVLGRSDDGGATVVRQSLTPGILSAFLLRADGTILLGKTDGTGLRSTDGGTTFAPWPLTIHLRGLAERGTRLYAVGDDVTDDGALFQSDDGNTLTRILRFRDILGPAQCGAVPATCAVPWAQLQPLINPNFDGGAPDLSMSAPNESGCGCRFTPGGLLPFWGLLLVAVLLRRRLR